MDIEPRLNKIKAAANSATPHQPVMSKHLAITFGALFFLYVGSENSVGGWTAALAKRLGDTPGNLWALAPMFFWAGLLAGRAFVPAILLRMKERTLLVTGLIISALGNATLLWTTTFYGAAACVAVIGVGFAGIYPLLVSWMVTHYGEEAKGTASVMFVLAALGRSHDAVAGRFHFHANRKFAHGIDCADGRVPGDDQPVSTAPPPFVL